MIKTFDMQFIRYINLFGRVTRVSAKHCFAYNNMLVFVVPNSEVERAIGKDNSNLKRLSDILSKRIRIVSEPRGIKDIQGFISTIVSPTKFQALEIITGANGKEVVITSGGRESKALLIGRQRAREDELKSVLDQYFGIKNLRIL